MSDPGDVTLAEVLALTLPKAGNTMGKHAGEEGAPPIRVATFMEAMGAVVGKGLTQITVGVCTTFRQSRGERGVGPPHTRSRPTHHCGGISRVAKADGVTTVMGAGVEWVVYLCVDDASGARTCNSA